MSNKNVSFKSLVTHEYFIFIYVHMISHESLDEHPCFCLGGRRSGKAGNTKNLCIFGKINIYEIVIGKFNG